jgi:hypothetical protein
LSKKLCSAGFPAIALLGKAFIHIILQADEMSIESPLLMILFPIPEGILRLHSPENLGMYAVFQDAYISI